MEWRGPITYWVESKIKGGLADMATDYILAAPIMIGVSIGVYALLNMFSSNLAKFGVAGVFVYGGIIAIAS